MTNNDGVAILGIVLFVLYWIPTFVAWTRKHPDKISILVLNLFLGWSVIGWVISLVWSLKSKPAAA